MIQLIRPLLMGPFGKPRASGDDPRPPRVAIWTAA